MHIHRKKTKLSLRDAGITAGIFLFTCLLCFLFRFIGGHANYAPMLFILSVFMTARFTEGYVWGIAASLVDVLTVNYLFTYPYFHFNFTLAGYPVTMISMLAVSLTTSALTSRAKLVERVRIEAEHEKTRSNLLRAVSHDLRTPLTSILGATSAVIEHGETMSQQERVELLKGAQENASWLIRMVENLLAITRVDAKEGGRIVKTPEAAEEIIAEAVAKFKKQFSNIQVQVRVPDELLMVPMDSLLIGQVLMNLMENAVIHGKTTTCIWLSLMRQGETAVFEVRDNGVGIAPEKLPHIFEGTLPSDHFSREDGKRSMGIGLSVCNTIVQAHGGTLTASNTPEGGACFSFSLSLTEDDNGQ